MPVHVLAQRIADICQVKSLSSSLSLPSPLSLPSLSLFLPSPLSFPSLFLPVTSTTQLSWFACAVTYLMTLLASLHCILSPPLLDTQVYTQEASSRALACVMLLIGTS